MVKVQLILVDKKALCRLNRTIEWQTVIRNTMLLEIRLLLLDDRLFSLNRVKKAQLMDDRDYGLIVLKEKVRKVVFLLP